MSDFLENQSNNVDVKAEIMRYVSFWPWILISAILFLFSATIFLRYSDNIYESKAIIEIIDKAQDSEMALPTSMTIFNRSMINLENEVGVISSVKIHDAAVKLSKSNIRFYKIGSIKNSEKHKSDWFNDYSLEFNIDIEDISKNINYYLRISEDQQLIISENENFENSLVFEKLSTRTKKHDLVFDIEINNPLDYSTRKLIIEPVEQATQRFMRSFSVFSVVNKGSRINFEYIDGKIADEYTSSLIKVFDNDGISDCQLEYKRIMEFVDDRFKLLSTELNLIEDRNVIQGVNDLTNIESDAQLILIKK